MSLSEQSDIYDQAADAYDAQYQKRKYRWRSNLIEWRTRAVSRGNILELGCGTGRLLLGVQDSADYTVGVDLSKSMLKHARKKGLNVVCADAHKLPFLTARFDTVLAGKGVFRYLDRAIALKECARVLRAKGILVVHQYAQKTWSFRKNSPVNTQHLDHCDQLIEEAKSFGLMLKSVELWRSVPFPPFALPIIGALGGRWWSQAVVMLEKKNE